MVFNDIDSISPNKLDMKTQHGTIKHFYGFNFTLGGIVSIAGDFEKLMVSNLWSWGYEDNALNQRAKFHNITIDRSIFYKITDPKFIRLKKKIHVKLIMMNISYTIEMLRGYII